MPVPFYLQLDTVFIFGVGAFLPKAAFETLWWNCTTHGATPTLSRSFQTQPPFLLHFPDLIHAVSLFQDCEMVGSATVH